VDDFSRELERGIAAVRKGELIRSLMFFDLAIELAEEDGKDAWRAWFNKGMVYTKLGQLEGAWECFKVCYESLDDIPDPKLVTQILLTYGKVSVRLRHFDEASPVFDRLSGIMPDDPSIMRIHGILLEGQGEYQQAVEVYERVIQNDPENIWVQDRMRAAVRQMESQYDINWKEDFLAMCKAGQLESARNLYARMTAAKHGEEVPFPLDIPDGPETPPPTTDDPSPSPSDQKRTVDGSIPLSSDVTGPSKKTHDPPLELPSGPEGPAGESSKDVQSPSENPPDPDTSVGPIAIEDLEAIAGAVSDDISTARNRLEDESDRLTDDLVRSMDTARPEVFNPLVIRGDMDVSTSPGPDTDVTASDGPPGSDPTSDTSPEPSLSHPPSPDNPGTILDVRTVDDEFTDGLVLRDEMEADVPTSALLLVPDEGSEVEGVTGTMEDGTGTLVFEPGVVEGERIPPENAGPVVPPRKRPVRKTPPPVHHRVSQDEDFLHDEVSRVEAERRRREHELLTTSDEDIPYSGGDTSLPRGDPEANLEDTAGSPHGPIPESHHTSIDPISGDSPDIISVAREGDFGYTLADFEEHAARYVEGGYIPRWETFKNPRLNAVLKKGLPEGSSFMVTSTEHPPRMVLIGSYTVHALKRGYPVILVSSNSDDVPALPVGDGSTFNSYEEAGRFAWIHLDVPGTPREREVATGTVLDRVNTLLGAELERSRVGTSTTFRSPKVIILADGFPEEWTREIYGELIARCARVGSTVAMVSPREMPPIPLRATTSDPGELGMDASFSFHSDLEGTVLEMMGQHTRFVVMEARVKVEDEDIRFLGRFSPRG